MQKIKKTHQVDPEEKCVTDKWTNTTDFIGSLSQRWRFDHVLQKLGKNSLTLFSLIMSHMERINARKMNTFNIV